MSTIWLHKTNRGKVVYESSRSLDDRPHFFSCKDIARIIRKVGCGHYKIPAELWVQFNKDFNVFLLSFVSSNIEEFGGGEFGGGGATRDVEDSETLERSEQIFILKEG